MGNGSNVNPDSLISVGRAFRAIGPWFSTTILALALVIMMFWRTDDRYRRSDAHEDIASLKEWVAEQIDHEIMTRVPPPQVTRDIAEIKATQKALRSDIEEMKVDLRALRRGSGG